MISNGDLVAHSTSREPERAVDRRCFRCRRRRASRRGFTTGAILDRYLEYPERRALWKRSGEEWQRNVVDRRVASKTRTEPK